jgi:hypothetical protein
MSIYDIFGRGTAGAKAQLDEIKKNKESIEKWTEELVKGGAELDKLINSGTAGFMEVEEAQNKLYEIEQKISDARAKNAVMQEDSNKILERTMDLHKQEAESLENAIDLASTYAQEMHLAAADMSLPVEARINAIKEERRYLDERAKHVQDLAKNENEQIKNLLNQGVINQTEALGRQERAAQEYADKKARIDDQIANNSRIRMDLERQQADELIQKQDDEINNLNRLKKEYEELRDTVFTKIPKDIFKPLTDSAKEALDEILALAKKLNELDGKTINVKVKQEIDTSSNQYGGFIGGSVFARVSSGEGYVPPGVARANSAALSALNQGSVTPSAKKLGIGRFDGPSGIDNIKTMLPEGSFVVSRKGMQAYDNAVSERERFQMGGFVGGTDGGSPIAEEEQQATSRFDLVLRVDGEDQRYPLFGPKETIDELSSQLEKRNLTRL